MHLYVYYAVQRARIDAARTAVRGLQQQLTAWTEPTLMCRADEPADCDPTWMEIYRDVDGTFEPRLDAAVTASGIDRFLSRPRHVERFVGLD